MNAAAPLELSFDGWRAAAREYLALGVPPHEAIFAATGKEPLLPGIAVDRAAGRERRRPPARVPAGLVALGRTVACHSSPARWGLLYRGLWRIACGERSLLGNPVDEDVFRLRSMAHEVEKDVHRIRALVRFRALPETAGERYVAFHRPDHFTLPLAAPFFARRFASMRWSILTPHASAHWDGGELELGPGVAAAPSGSDELEVLWRAYYASSCNPARLSPALLRSHLPERFRSALPEGSEIASLLRAGRDVASSRSNQRAARSASSGHRESPPPEAPASGVDGGAGGEGLRFTARSAAVGTVRAPSLARSVAARGQRILPHRGQRQ